MRKYVVSSLLEVQAAMQFRLNFFLSIVVDLVPNLAIIAFWMFVTADGSDLHGYSSRDLVTYYLIGALLANWSPSVWWEVSEGIRDGSASRLIVSPLDYFTYYITRQLGSQLVLFGMSLCVMLPVLVVLGDLVVRPTVAHLVLMVPALAVGFLIRYAMQFCIHMLAFWYHHIEGLLSLLRVVESVLSGALMPLEFLPAYSGIARYLPFAVLRYVPLQIYLGEAERGPTLSALLVGVGYAIVFVVVARALWKRGVKHYAGPGI